MRGAIPPLPHVFILLTFCMDLSTNSEFFISDAILATITGTVFTARYELRSHYKGIGLKKIKLLEVSSVSEVRNFS